MGLTTGDSGSFSAPSWEAFQAVPHRDTGRVPWVKVNTLFVPLLCPASNWQSSSGANETHGSLGEAGSVGRLQELATGSCWNRMRYGEGFTAGCLLKGKEWGGMQVSGETALLALVLAPALPTQLQAQLRTCTGSDIE